MEFIKEAITLLMSLDQLLLSWSAEHPTWVFGLLFVIIFMETGLVIMPFLPGDSILFIGGMICASAGLNVLALIALLIFAAIAGDALNYSIGRHLGVRAYSMAGQGWFRFVKQSYLDKTHAYFEKYGGYTIIVGRFVPFVRTFAPFMAGIGQLSPKTFLSFNVIGGVLWISSMVGLGYFFGNLPWVKANLKLITIALVVVPALPVFFKIYQEYRANQSLK